jgi:cytochrome c biogenesis protein ResB
MGAHSSLLIILMGVWGAVALCLIGLLVYRGVIGRNEEIELMVDQAEHRFVEEQQAISSRLERLDAPIRYLSIAAGVLLLVIIALWIYQGLQSS